MTVVTWSRNTTVTLHLVRAKNIVKFLEWKVKHQQIQTLKRWRQRWQRNCNLNHLCLLLDMWSQMKRWAWKRWKCRIGKLNVPIIFLFYSFNFQGFSSYNSRPLHWWPLIGLNLDYSIHIILIGSCQESRLNPDKILKALTCRPLD